MEDASGMIALFSKVIQENKRRRIMMFTTLVKAIGQRQSLIIMKACLIILLLSLSASRNRTVTRRSCRRFVRNTGWWNLVRNTYDESRFKKTFRVSRSTF